MTDISEKQPSNGTPQTETNFILNQRNQQKYNV